MSAPLWVFDELVRVAGGTADGRPAVQVTGLSIDTRTLAPGDVFVALTDQRDGHEFVDGAFARGAAAALVRRDYDRKPGDGTLIRVDEPLRALERIGVAARRRLAPSARVIAVTGSAGKTGTKEMLRACLMACASSPDRVHAPEKSFNNHWGVPLTLARMPADTEYAVLEIGMNHAGEIRPLTQMVRPHIAVVTNVLPVHVGNFADGMEGVAKAKAEIFEGLEPGGAAIILQDSPHSELLRATAAMAGARVLTFGPGGGADASLVDISEQPGAGAEPITAISTRVNDGGEGFGVEYDLGMPGEHLAINSLAVILALQQLGCLKPAALRRLGGLRPVGGRGARQLIDTGERPILLIDEAYNANPASMRAALGNLAGVPGEVRRVAIMGDMLELGAEASRYHVGLLDAACRTDLVLCCGPQMKHLFEALPVERRGAWAPTSAGLIPHVIATIRPGDAVMVKGSLGSRMAPVVEAIKKHFAPSRQGG
ncbi:MAG: UDP-N-acetylmuramoyl-tripeptide--D-alanyl-D-alanine ligase [Hyphomicrobiaceae bacterium]|nr:UDP-N-acetylmuramoyl-tripeptide--D-alanyl-D-alanine ligase [Hyphomicrobiaceae bacterium]